LFRRNDESEWARFSKAFPSSTKEEKKEENGQVEASAPVNERNPNTPAPSVDEERPAVTPVAPTSRILAESSLSLPRPAALPTTPVFSEEVESTIGPTTMVDGVFKSDSGIRVHGAAKGEIESAKAVFIEENAKVAAKVTAAQIVVAGEVNGELCCSGRVEIKPSGRVTGTINAGTLVMQEGAFFDGQLKMKAAGSEATVSH